jgi:ribonuclease P protein component
MCSVAARIVSGASMSDSKNSDPRRAVPVLRTSTLQGVRLRKHADYQRVYASSRKRQASMMSWFLAPQPAPQSGPRVGLTAGKVLGKAHERNRIKRRMREVLRRHMDLLPRGFDLILHPRRTVLSAEFTKLDGEVVRILMQAKVEAARMPESAALKPNV